MTIHLFPIEPIDERYSADWYRWWPTALHKSGLGLFIYDGARLQGRQRGEAIQNGQFLDAIDTHYYKASQLAKFVENVKMGNVKDGDTVLLLDGWNPAVTSLAYIRDVAKIKFKIVLVLHAGTWDPWDHLSQCGMGKWAKYNETGWIIAADAIFVATDFHKNLLLSVTDNRFASRPDSLDIEKKIRVTGFPLMLSELDKYKIPVAQKEKMVVFPHRLAIEKQPQFFYELRNLYEAKYPDDAKTVKWIRTQDTYTDKESLYRMLARSRVAFSSAKQETWGIVQLESWYLGAVPVVPDRLSYKELYPRPFRYVDMNEAVNSVYGYLNRFSEIDFKPSRDPRLAFTSIVNELKGLSCT